VIFQLDKSQIQIQKAVKDFVKGEFKKEFIDKLLENQAFPEEIWKKAGDLGFIGIHYPEKFSGQGLRIIENVLVAEELCRGDSSVGVCLSKAGQGAEFLLHYGSEAQRENWLARIAEARALSCAAITEPGLGNDFFLSQTTAVRDGADWVINGEKSFVVNGGPLAGFYIVLCNTAPEAVDVNQRFSTILVEADREGVAVRDVGHRLGGRLMFIGNVRFHQVRVPFDNLVGREGAGLAQVTAYLCENRILAAAQALGIAQGAFDRSFPYVKKREQFGRKIIDFQVTRQKVAEMATKIEASRLLTYQAAWYFDQNGINEKLSAMAKLHASRTAVEVCDEAIQLLGGYGYVQEYEVERFFRDAKTADLLDGTQITQKNMIANELL
jgi:alkylation response protein AidB-like acyl-CoA dehydrogenase